MGLLYNDDEGTRAAAAIALGEIGGKEVVEPLMDALKHSDDTVRRIAAEALEALGKIKDNKNQNQSIQPQL